MPRRKTGSHSTPPADSSPYLGKSSDMFKSADIEALSWASGLPLVANVTMELMAFAVNQAFSIASFFSKAEGYPASPSDLREYYKGIHISAESLLVAMGFSGDSNFVEKEMRPSRHRRHPSINHLQKGARFLDIVVVFPGHFDTLCQQIETLPRALALTMKIADSEMKSLEDVSLKAGKVADDFKNKLFMYLAATFHLCFGFPPRLGPERSSRDADPTMWVSEVLKIAAERITSHVLQDDPAEVRASNLEALPYLVDVKKAAALKINTQGDRLARGWRDWRKLDEGVRAGFLMTYGPTQTP